MKRFALVGLSILCLSLAATTSVKAGSRTEQIAISAATITTIGTTQLNPSFLPIRARTSTGFTAMSADTKGNNSANKKLTPFELVSLAYKGEYRTQGIPGFGKFLSDVSSKKITAKDLVKAAIDAKQLSLDTQIDGNYLSNVEQQLSLMYN